ncbi:MAG TPA: ATP-binding protein [Candidatus Paceibacterota bacterium]|nr:ATP-binding protein [Candidatus Paceibacterota bacterium]
MPSAQSAVRTSRSEVGFHHGKTLLKVANTYPSLFEAVLEAVQNAIDSEATKIGIIINRKTRSISIIDNGNGVTREQLDEALASVGSTLKQRDKLGQFGYGLISSLGKCESMSFTSCPAGGDEYLEWTFDTAKIANQVRAIKIPVAKRNFVYRPNRDGPPLPRGWHATEWRTRVSINNYVTDRKISEIRSADALKEAIVEKFGIPMRRNDVSVSVDITNENGSRETAVGKAKLFSGKKLPEVVISDKDAGNTIFRLYLAKPGRQGKVLVGVVGDDYRFAFGVFAKEASELLSTNIIELFVKEGIFEGEILTTNGKLHDSRKKLEQNDAYVGFCATIEEWFLKHGKKHLKEVKDERQGQRIQDLSLKSLENVQSVLSDDAFDHLRKGTIDTFRYGTVGAGHTNPEDRKIVGTQENPSLSTVASARKRGEGGESHGNEPPEREHAGHIPFTAAGPRGQQRRVVKGGSRGLQFDHTAMRSDGPLAVLDAGNGIIFFNVEHPAWVAASEAGDRELMQLQEVGALVSLVRHTMPEEYHGYLDLYLTDLLGPLSFLLRNSPSFSSSARTKASKEKKE